MYMEREREKKETRVLRGLWKFNCDEDLDSLPDPNSVALSVCICPAVSEREGKRADALEGFIVRGGYIGGIFEKWPIG